MLAYTLRKIVTKLNGPIYPTGDISFDEECKNNIESLLILMDGLLHDINKVANMHHNSEASIVDIIDRAKSFIRNLPEEFFINEEIKMKNGSTINFTDHSTDPYIGADNDN